MINSRRMVWRGHVVRMGEKKGGDNCEDLNVDARIVKWILKKRNGVVWTGFIWLVIETSCGLL
jgi:hypothetical protein